MTLLVHQPQPDCPVARAAEICPLRVARMRRHEFLPLSLLFGERKLPNAHGRLERFHDRVVAAIDNADTRPPAAVFFRRIDREDLVLLILVEAEMPEALYFAVFALRAAEDQASVLGPLIVKEDDARGLAVFARILFALDDHPRALRFTGQHHTQRAIRLHNVEAAHGDLIEGHRLGAVRETGQQRAGKYRRQHAGVDCKEALAEHASILLDRAQLTPACPNICPTATKDAGLVSR